MSRDHTKLDVFSVAHSLAVRIYALTEDMPPTETYGLRAQVRRAALSVPTNIVEGCARSSTKEYLRFLDVAVGSASEAQYLLRFAADLELLPTALASTRRDEYGTLIRRLQQLRTTIARLDRTPGTGG